MAKSWRRSAAVDSGAVELPPGPTLTDQGGETVEASGIGAYVGTHFLWPSYSPDGVNGWVDDVEQPIGGNPTNIDATGHLGEFIRACITTGNLDPVTGYSNVVEVT